MITTTEINKRITRNSTRGKYNVDQHYTGRGERVHTGRIIEKRKRELKKRTYRRTTTGKT